MPEWESSRLGMAPCLRMASAVYAAAASEFKMVGVGAVGFGMDHTFADCHCPSAAFSPQFIKSSGFWADAAIVCNVCPSHGGRKHAVAEGYVSNLDGT